MIRGIARILWEQAQFEADPEEHPQLRPLALHVMGLYGRPAHDTTAEEWEEALLECAKKPIVNHQELSVITESRRPASENPSAFR